MSTIIPTSLSSEALLPVLTAQLGSEILAKQVIQTLERAAENEAAKRRQQQQQQQFQQLQNQQNLIQIQTTLHSSHQLSIETQQKLHVTSPLNYLRPPSPSPLSSSNSSSILSSSNILNVLLPNRTNTTSPSPAPSSSSHTPPQQQQFQFQLPQHPSPSTSAFSNNSSTSTTTLTNCGGDKPFPVNIRGRKRVYTDEERRLRKNNSSKKSREKHTEKVMEKKVKLQELQDKHRDLIEKRKQLDKEIQDHRKHLCPYCLNVVEEALQEIGKGQDIVVLKRVNFCCSQYHAARQLEAAVVVANSANSANIGGQQFGLSSIKKEPPSEFTQ